MVFDMDGTLTVPAIDFQAMYKEVLGEAIYAEVTGSITYNGHTMDEFVPQRTSAYISQNDLHVGEMTVRETLAFSARVQGIGTNYDMLAELARREKEANIKPDPDIDIYMNAATMEGQEASVVTEYIIKILELDVCADTLVGNEMIRGISGGQRKRLTTGEMLVGPAKALFMDEISTGLDSSTTYQIVNSIKQSIHNGRVCPTKNLNLQFSSDTDRLQHINSIRKAPVGAQIKRVIDLLYEIRDAAIEEHLEMNDLSIATNSKL